MERSEKGRDLEFQRRRRGMECKKRRVKGSSMEGETVVDGGRVAGEERLGGKGVTEGI